MDPSESLSDRITTNDLLANNLRMRSSSNCSGYGWGIIDVFFNLKHTHNNS